MHKCYEMVVMVRQDASSQQADAVCQKTVGAIEEQGGKVGRLENWGLRNLAYRINNNRKAYYFCINFTADGAVPQELERQLKINEDVIRVLIVKTESIPTEPSVVMGYRHRNHEDTEE